MCTLGGSRHSERVIYICFTVEISILSYYHIDVNQAEPVMGNYSDKPILFSLPDLDIRIPLYPSL